MKPNGQTYGQNIYWIDAHWSDESLQNRKNNASILNISQEYTFIYSDIYAFSLIDEFNIHTIDAF